MRNNIFTIGHSNHTLDAFVEALEAYGITAVADVRSYPYSNKNPQFDREELSEELKAHRITYVYLGKELGGRSDDPTCYVNGKVQYDRLAQTALFRSGIERVYRGIKDFVVTLMCAEGEPLACHRSIMISRHLKEHEIAVKHILRNRQLEEHDATMDRLMQTLNLNEKHMFKTRVDLLSEAYITQAERIAYEIDPQDATMRARFAVSGQQ